MVSQLVLLASWLSIFAVLWLKIFRIIPLNDLFSWAMVVVFFLIAFFASALKDAKK